MLRTALRGTQRYDSGDIARRLENAGARIEVVNNADFFGYVVDGLSGKMDQALEILIEILQKPTFADDEIEKEKSLQLARIKQAPGEQCFVSRQPFHADPFRRSRIRADRNRNGSRDRIDYKGRIASVVQNQQRPLVPTIIIAGDTNGTGLIAPLADVLTNEDLHEREMASLPVPSVAAETKETVETASRQQTALVYGFPGVTRAGNDRYPLMVLENIVSGLGGRFFDVIREKQGLAYTVRTENVFFSKSGAVYTYAAFSPENEEKVRASLQSEIDRLRKGGVTAEELSKSIAYTIGEHEMGLQTRTGLVLEYARALFGGETVVSVGDYGRLVRNVKRGPGEKGGRDLSRSHAITSCHCEGKKVAQILSVHSADCDLTQRRLQNDLITAAVEQSCSMCA
jgi:zinc protease